MYIWPILIISLDLLMRSLGHGFREWNECSFNFKLGKLTLEFIFFLRQWKKQKNRESRNFFSEFFKISFFFPFFPFFSFFSVLKKKGKKGEWWPMGTTLFWWKGPPKDPLLNFILHFDLLDYQVDTLSFILRPKF